MYKRRIKIFLSLIGLVLLGVLGRLAWLQFAQAQWCREEIGRSLRDVRVLPTMRGQILDRQGRILATDETTYDLCLDYRFMNAACPAGQKWARRQIKQIERKHGVTAWQAGEIYEQLKRNTWRLVTEAAGANPQAVSEAVTRSIARVESQRELLAQRELRPAEEDQEHPIVTHLDEASAIRLKMALDNTIGASIIPSRRRTYPYGSLACHLIGYTGEVSAEEQARYNFKPEQADRITMLQGNYRDGDWIGKSGVERLYEKVLRGQRGYRELNQLTGESSHVEPATPGRDLHLSLDIKLQESLTTLLTQTNYNGCIVLLSVPKGEVLAMVSLPGYDPNTLRQEYARLASDVVNKPLYHRAISQLYSPGSTAKTVAALAGLRSGMITTQTSFNCRGYLYEPGRFRCFHGTVHGDISLVPAICKSCDVYFYHVGERLGLGPLVETYSMFGFDRPPIPDFGTAGRLPSPADRHIDSRVEGRFMAIGQGVTEVTPLHVANAMATIARDGEFLSPTLLVDGDDPRFREKLPFSPEHLAAVREGMREVVNNPGGTAYKFFREGEPLDVSVSGKTGTAQVSPLWVDTNRNGQRDADDFYRRGDMAWFAGFAPSDHPQVAFAVVLEYVTEGTGGSNSAPVAKKMLQICRQMGYLNTGNRE